MQQIFNFLLKKQRIGSFMKAQKKFSQVERLLVNDENEFQKFLENFKVDGRTAWRYRAKLHRAQESFRELKKGFVDLASLALGEKEAKKVNFSIIKNGDNHGW